MNEDIFRGRTNYSTETLAAVHHVGLNLLKADTYLKGGIERKYKQVNRSDRETIVSALL